MKLRRTFAILLISCLLMSSAGVFHAVIPAYGTVGMETANTAAQPDLPQEVNESNANLPAAADKIRVGWVLYPGGAEVHDGVYSGYNYDYLMEIAKYTGWTYEFVEGDLSTCSEMLAQGEIDIIGSLFYDESREEIFDFSNMEYGHTYITLFTSRNSGIKPYDFEAFDGIKVGVISNSLNRGYLEAFASDNGFSYTTMEFSNIQELTNAVINGEVDAGIRGAFTVDADTAILAEFAPLPYYFVTTKGNTEVLVGLNRGLNMIKINSPYLERDLYEKHFAPPVSFDLTEGELAVVEKSKKTPITVGIIPNNAPMCYWDEEKQEFTGIHMEMLDEISKKTGLKFKYMALNLKKNTPVGYLKQGLPQLVFGILRTENFARDKELLLSDKVMDTYLVVVGRKGSDFTTNPSEKTIAVMKGFQVALEYAREHFPEHRILECDSLKVCMDAVSEGDADATVYLRSSVSYFLQNSRYEDLQINQAFEKEMDLCVAELSESGGEVTSIINKGLAMITEGERNKIMMSYTIMNPYRMTAEDIIYRYRLPLAVILALFVIAATAMISLIKVRQKSANEIRAAYEQEKAALKLAEKASAAKSNFMSRMSHEIRTPLNAIIGYNSIARGEMTEARSEEELRQANRKAMDCLVKSDIASKHLLTIINDVLDMAAIESGKIKAVKEPFNFREMISSLTVLFASQAKTKGVDFDVIFETQTEEWVIGDQMRISQILTNLLSNAVKFTSTGGKVRLAISQNSVPQNPDLVQIHFEIMDTGIGMEQRFLARIWQPFEQEDDSISRNFGGTGLGLAITKNLVELMDGDIRIESEPGEGTTFYLDITLERTKEANRGKDRKKGKYDFSGNRILLVEDNKMNMEIAKRLLSSVGFVVDSVWNGREAVARFEESPEGTYAAILMDIQMPEMDGYQAARKIRSSSHADGKSIPIIAMTADAFAENVAQAMASGMNGHIAKPIDINILFETLKNILK